MRAPMHGHVPPAAALLLMLIALIGCAQAEDPVSQFDRGAYGQSVKAFAKRAQSGDAEAENYLGIHYYLGAGVGRDFRQAATWFEKAALARHAAAQRNLGILYLRGLGVEKDNVKAYGWFYEAFTHGDKKAEAYLSFLSTAMTGNQIMKARAWVDETLRQQPGVPR